MSTPARAHLASAILSVADHLRAWGVTLPDDLEAEFRALQAEYKAAPRRDRREPAQAEKSAAEERIARVFRRIFKRQRAQVLEKLQAQYPDRKSIKYNPDQVRDERGRFASEGEEGQPPGSELIGKAGPLKAPIYKVTEASRLSADAKVAAIAIRGDNKGSVLASPQWVSHSEMITLYDTKDTVDNYVRLTIYPEGLHAFTSYAGVSDNEEEAINNIHKAADRLVNLGMAKETPLIIHLEQGGSYTSTLKGIFDYKVIKSQIVYVDSGLRAIKADIYDWFTFPADDDPDLADLIAELTEATRGGIALFGQRAKPAIDWTLTNVEAAQRARAYAYELVRGINETSRDALRQVISAFVETPGMTLGDVEQEVAAMFGEQRAEKISITEITRAYASGEVLAGEALQAEFPGVRIIKKWYANQDEIMCPICGALADEDEIELSEKWVVEDVEYDKPPAHVNCRCALETSTALAELD